MTVNHAQIQAFLQKNPPQLRYESAASDEVCTKAGIVPFVMVGNERKYMLMRPVAKRPELGEPEFQLCKGTRMYLKDGQWLDMRGDIKDANIMEKLAETALREGIEEIGLKLENIETLYDLGAFTFTSASTCKTLTSWMFAASVLKTDDFLPMSDIASVTAERGFFTLAELKKASRPDHFHMLEQIDRKL